ncbi:MAG: hypothetical protein JKY14_02865 [Paraglaciecola sp.]|nr:hypothetical protein [Paraglaciecola sp.]
MKTYINQFKITAAGILSIAVLSSAMVVATVSTSSAKKVEHVSEIVLAGMCKRSGGQWSGSKNLIGNILSGYSCVVHYSDGSTTDVACDDAGCEGNTYKKNKRGGPSIKAGLYSRTTLGKKDPISQALRKPQKKSHSYIRK